MKDKIISVELLNKVINYLATKPYIETFQLIQQLSSLVDVKEDKKEKVS